jgi:hypothetical protein
VLGAAAMPLTNPVAGRFAVAGITPGMSLADAVMEVHQTFVEEGLTDIHEATAESHLADGGAVQRLTFEQSASTPVGTSGDYREDRFKLRLAGPPGQEWVTSVTRDYLAPVGLSRAAVLHNLESKYGPPSTSNVPDASIAPNSAMMTWLISPGGGREGGGPQSSTELTCGAGMMSYFDHFDNAGNNNGDVLDLLRDQKRGGCGLVMQVSFAFDAVHYEMYDGTAAASALGGGTVAKVDRAAQRRAREEAAEQAAAKLRY